MHPQADSSTISVPVDELEGQLFAAIDLGSNSFHLVVARMEHGQLHVIDRIKEMVRLAEGVDGSGRLDPVVEGRALDCLTILGQRIAQISQTRVAAVGTNALRRMKAGWRFLNEAESRLGVPIEIISGHEEARLVYLGVAHGVFERGNQRLVIDIGGGSTEFAVGSDFTPQVLESLYFGCVGVAQKYFHKGKITPKRWRKADSGVQVELQRIASGLKGHGWQEVIGTSGTMRAVRKALIEQGWSTRGITSEGIGKLREAVLSARHVEELDLAGVSERRRPVFASGALIVHACMEALEIDQILVADYALREGLLYDLIGRIREQDPRDLAVAGLMDRYNVDAEQARRVEQAAVDLFEQVADDWNLGPVARDWLTWGSLLHEVGLTISHHGYHRHGAYLIENSDLPGFSRQEQAILATLVRLHRRKPGATGLEPMLERMRKPVLRVAALLRIAVLANRTHNPLPRLPIKVKTQRNRLRLTFADGWLNDHPLTLADLEQERGQISRLGIQLEFS